MLGLYLGLGIPIFCLTLLGTIFTLVNRWTARRMAADRAQAAREGIVLDAGVVWMTIRYHRYRTSNFYVGVGFWKIRVAAILTNECLRFSPASRHSRPIARADFAQFTVDVAEDGALRLCSDDPPNATGSIEYRIPVTDPHAWVAAITEAGARAA